jgi:LPS sulfotransferase NodH
MREWAAEWGLPATDALSKIDFDLAYLAAAVRAGKAGTEIFGLRLQQDCLALLSDTLDRICPGLPSDAHRLEKAFGKVLYIHLTRTDKVAQAVSLVKAEQTGLWHLNADGTEFERLAAPRAPRYDVGLIHREVGGLERGDAAWVEWFARHTIHPLRIRYETFANDPARTLVEICQALGMEPPKAELPTPSLARLSDDTNAEWISRYKADVTDNGMGAD